MIVYIIIFSFFCYSKMKTKYDNPIHLEETNHLPEDDIFPLLPPINCLTTDPYVQARIDKFNSKMETLLRHMKHNIRNIDKNKRHQKASLIVCQCVENI